MGFMLNSIVYSDKENIWKLWHTDNVTIPINYQPSCVNKGKLLLETIGILMRTCTCGTNDPIES
jgi:hypothetical protein